MPDQRSVSDQLRELVAVANARGLYDAADYLDRVVTLPSTRPQQDARMREQMRSTRAEKLDALERAAWRLLTATELHVWRHDREPTAIGDARIALRTAFAEAEEERERLCLELAGAEVPAAALAADIR